MGGAAAEQAAVAPPPVFLDRTYTMVDTSPDDVVSWSENGDSFIIKKVDAFEAMLPAFFNHRNFLSFVRQLNLYGESNLFVFVVSELVLYINNQVKWVLEELSRTQLEQQ